MSMDEAKNIEIPPRTIQSHHQSELFETGRLSKMFDNLKLIGEGAFGKVYKGIHKIEGMKYAIKRIYFSIDKFQNIQEHPFFREVFALTKLSHPSIVRHHSTWIEENINELEFADQVEDIDENRVYEELQTDQISLSDLGFEWENDCESKSDKEQENTIFTKHYAKTKLTTNLNLILNIQMTYYSPRTLKDLIINNTEWTFERKLSIIKQLLEGLRFIHANGFIHRDIKPSNIFFTSEKSIIIGDFGVAIESFGKIHDKDVFGTFNYTPPEIEKQSGFDQRIDIYAAGIIFYELFETFATEHERYFKLKALRNMQMNENFKYNFPFISMIIEKMVCPDPENRYFSINDILHSEEWKSLFGKETKMQ